MILEGEAIVLGTRKFAERSTLISVFAKEHGLLTGLLKAQTLNPGTTIHMTWKARLTEHLGTIKCEMLEDITPLIYNSYEKLILLNNGLFTLLKVLPEKFPKPELYEAFSSFIKILRHNNYYHKYIIFELILLKNIGFGIDLSRCAVSNAKNVAFISPKTGKAVSSEVGNKYQSKLFPVTRLLLNTSKDCDADYIANKKEFAESLKITDYFLHKFFLTPMEIREVRFRKQTLQFFEN